MVKSFFTKVPRPFNKEKIVSSTNSTGKTGYPQRMKLDSYFIIYTKISSKQIKYLNIKAKTIKLSGENRERLMILDLATISWT